MARLRAEALLASEEARRLHPHHILLMRAKLKITKCTAANMEQLQRKVSCSCQSVKQTHPIAVLKIWRKRVTQ